jgi:CRP-like cAMP-binding protein
VGAAPLRVSLCAWQAILGMPPLARDELEALNSVVKLRRVPAGAAVLSRQQHAEDLVAVVEGLVGLGLAPDDAPFHLERSVRGPRWLDLSSAWLGGCYGQDARAVGDSLVMDIPVQAVRQAISQFPELLDRLMLCMAQTVHSLNGITHDLMHKDAEKRLVAWLLHASGAASSGSESLVLKERKRDIAAQLAITPETLSRLMRQLTLKNLIEVQGYRIELLDIAALRTLSAD